MLPDRVSNPGPLTYESVPYRLRYAARRQRVRCRGLIFGFTFIYIGWFCED